MWWKQKNQYTILKRKSVSTIKNLGSRNLIPERKEIRLFAIMRNESLRLPYFLEYYKNLGVDRFFLIDNNSTDGSVQVGILPYSAVSIAYMG